MSEMSFRPNSAPGQLPATRSKGRSGGLNPSKLPTGPMAALLNGKRRLDSNRCGPRNMPSTPAQARQANPDNQVDGRSGFEFAAECLAGDELEPTVIADRFGAHRFQRLFRAFRETDLARMAPSSAQEGLDLIQRTVRELRTINTDLGGRSGYAMSAECRPILGPTGAVHALLTKVGKADESEAIPLVPLEFDATRLAHFGRPDGSMPTLFPIDTTWTLPALLERVVWLDKRLDLIAMFDPVAPASQWCESLVVDDPLTKARHHLWMAARAAADDHGLPIVRAVIADITAVSPPPNLDPVYEHLATRTARGHGSALMDLRTTLMHSFYCHDDPRMSLWRNRNPELHPADMPAVMKILADLANNRPTRIALRIRFTDKDPWTTLHANCTPLANYARPQANIDFWIEDRPRL